MSTFEDPHAASDLEFIINKIKATLKKEAKGSFETGEACSKLFEKLLETNNLDGKGCIVMQAGCRAAVTGHIRSYRHRRKPSGDGDNRQSTFNDFDPEWIDEEVALSEGSYARRKERRLCTFHETKLWVGIGYRNANAALRNAQMGQAILDEHPEWKETPNLTLEQILLKKKASPK